MTTIPLRSLQYTQGASNKFWNIERKGSELTVHFGRIGTAGQTKTTDLPTVAAAEKQYDKLVREKLGKGYVDSSKSSAPASAAPATKSGKTDAVAHAIDPKILR